MKKLLDSLHSKILKSKFAEEVTEAEIEALVKAKEFTNDGWIPVSERLPEEKDWYQCTCDNKMYWQKPIVRDLYYYPTIKAFVDNIRYSEHGCKNIERYNWTKDVTAYRPLPAPYQPKGA